MSFSVNTLTHGADLRHALRSNENKGMSDSPPCCDGTYVVLLGQGTCALIHHLVTAMLGYARNKQTRHPFLGVNRILCTSAK